MRNPRRSTEIEVYRKLEKELGDDWWVFYSRPWLGLTPDGGEKDGECDFVVAHARRGVLFIEVKGGGVGWSPDSDQWTSRDRDGITHRIKDPVHQARICKHEILRKLKKLRGFEHRFFVMRHGVLLPDSVNPGRDLGPDRPLRLFCFADTYQRRLADWIESRFDEDRETDHEEPLGVDGLHGLRDLLAKPFQLELCLGPGLRAEDREINVLTQQQFHLLEAIGELPRVIITGGAGTGKTVMAGRLAQDLTAAGKRTLLVCYNRPLAERLAQQAKNAAGLTVQSFHQLCMSVIAKAGGTAPAEIGARQTYFDETLPAAAADCASDYAVENYDAIIVDEGQDFREVWWLLIETLLKHDGQLRVFADNNQRLYGDVGRLKRDLQLAPIQLTWNLRNTKAIHEAAYRHYHHQNVQVRCDGPAGEAPRLVEVADRPQLSGEVSKLVHSLTRQHDIAPDDVAVLVPNEAYLEELSPHGRLAGFACTDAERRESGRLAIDTVRRFKGLESLVTIIVTDASLAASEELAYVALSRARTRTILVGQSRHLRQVLAVDSA
jgi:hypothetical protein